jgi:MFS family permease
MYLGGFAADRLAARDPRWRIWVMALVVGVTVPAALVQYLAGSTAVAIAGASVAASLMVAYYGPLLAVTQGVVPPRMRAFSNAVLGLIFNLIGLGLGPWVVGMGSDLLARDFGFAIDGLRYSLALSLAASAAAALLYVHAARFWQEERGAGSTA